MKLLSKLLLLTALSSFGASAWACTGSCKPADNNPEPKVMEIVVAEIMR